MKYIACFLTLALSSLAAYGEDHPFNGLIVDDLPVSTLDGINLYDVERVEVLKDAPIYGSRGANGAIIVITKRGRP